MEKRKPTASKSSPLPVDYLKMVGEIFAGHFETGLKLYSEHKPDPKFEARGSVYSDEVLLAVSLMNEGQLAATTVYASIDFDPKASVPTVQDLLEACVDAVGTVFSSVLNPDKPEVIEQLADDSLSALENIPFHWTELEANQKRVYVKMDKSNLSLDEMTEDWLNKNDPTRAEREAKEAEETEKLFVTGPSKKSGTGFSH